MATKMGLKRAALRASNKEHVRKYGKGFVKITYNDIQIETKRQPDEVWRSPDFLVQIYYESDDIERISICRTELEATGRWVANITWDELQAIKTNVGRGERDAIEVFPRNADVVNVANMRHLWVFKKDYLGFIWRSGKPE